MALTIGEILVNLRASTAAFSKDLDKANALAFDSSQQIQRSFQVMGTMIAAAMAAAAAGISGFTVKSIDLADQTGKLAQRTGLSTEQFSALAYAAKQENVDVDTLSRGLVILSKNLEKSNEQTLEGKAAHSALATIFRGNVPVFKSTQDAFLQIGQRLSELPTGFQQTALAALIFGRNGAALLPILNQGADGIQTMMHRAQELGVVISTQTAKDAEKFNQTLKDMHAVLDGVGLKIAAAVLPTLQALSERLLALSQNQDLVNEVMQAAGPIVKFLAEGLIVIGTEVRNLAADYRLLKAPAGSLEDLAKAFRDHNEEVKRNYLEAQRFFNLLDGIGVPALQKTSSALETLDNFFRTVSGAKAAKETADAAAAALAAAAAHTKLLADVTSALAAISKETTVFTLGAQGAELLKLKTEGASEAQLKLVKTAQDLLSLVKAGAFNPPETEWAAYNKTLDETAIHNDAFWQQFRDQWASLKASVQTPLEQFEAAFARLNELYASGAGDVETYNRAWKAMTDQYLSATGGLENINKSAQEFGRQMSNAFAAVIVGARSFKDVLAQLIEKIIAAILEAEIFGPLMNSLFPSGGGGIGGFFAGLFGLAGGGSLAAGQPAIVGEAGPEIFVPATAGTIVPNGGLGMTYAPVYNIDARGAAPGTDAQIRRALRETEDRAVRRAVLTQREISLRTA